MTHDITDNTNHSYKEEVIPIDQQIKAEYNMYEGKQHSKNQ